MPYPKRGQRAQTNKTKQQADYIRKKGKSGAKGSAAIGGGTAAAAGGGGGG